MNDLTELAQDQPHPRSSSLLPSSTPPSLKRSNSKISFRSIDLNEDNDSNEFTLNNNDTNYCPKSFITSNKAKMEENADKNKAESVSFFSLFQYASKTDKLFIAIGSLFSLCLGLLFPSIVLMFGNLSDIFIEYEVFRSFAEQTDKTISDEYYQTDLKNVTDSTNFYEKMKIFYQIQFNINLDDTRKRLDCSKEYFVQIFNDSIFNPNGTMYIDNFKSNSGRFSLEMAFVAIGFAFLAYFALMLWECSARNQIFRIKLLFFRSIIHQDISWFDTKNSGDFATKITNDINLIQQGMGDKIGLTIMSFSTLFFSIAIAFYHGWELTLVCLSVMPFMAIAFAIIGKMQTKFSKSESDSYSKAGTIAKEVINLIQTVYAFGGQEKEITRYRESIEPARKNGIRRSMFSGLMLGLMYFFIYASYGLAFWYGVRLMTNGDKYKASTMLIIFFNVLMGAFSLGQTLPYFESIFRACGAADNIFEVIKKQPKIDSLSQEGKRINVKGGIKFRNVQFSYPSRKDVRILNNLSFDTEPGQTIAIVGSSGCGKSTIIHLIQRFYDCDSGQVLIDNYNIKDLNVGSLRDQIGVVGQEPVLFGYSIQQNIAFGNPEASMEDIIQAAKEANAYDFIQSLPNKFETLVGERGAQLSGGQKQRIAIARALIRCPKILLLDESTSALDSESEVVVQAALDKASIGRTTLIIAHRLSTIRNADKIIVIDGGNVKEIGTHQELIDARGIYYNMAHLQNLEKEKQAINSNNYSINSNTQIELSKSIEEICYSNNKIINDEDNDDDNINQSLPLRQLIKFIIPDKNYLIIATLFSFICGLSIPIYAFVFGDVLGVLSSTDKNYINSQVLKYSLIFLTMGIICGILQFFQIYLFGISSENLTFRLRNDLFRTILQQDMSWFNCDLNSTGVLCARLSNDASAVQGATGSRLSILAQTISILSAGIFISMMYCWKLSLVLLCFVPIIIIAVYFQLKIITGMSIFKRKNTEKAAKIAVETIVNIRTVASLHLELTFWVNYQNMLEIDFQKTRWEPHIKALTFGFTQVVFNIAYSISLFYGSRLIIDKEINYSQLFKSTEAVLFGTNMIGQSVAFSPDYQKGKIAANAIFKLLNRIPKIVTNSILGDKPNECRGEIEFRQVEFYYPNRPKACVLKRINFNVKSGQTVALVGRSGCGKSTCTQLIERFYDTNYGQVLVDDKNVRQLNIEWLRNQIGIVCQEPLLFDKSIAENIAYGDNSRQVKMDEIVRAAQKANIHEFIKSLPKQYETSVGDKGTQLSGGQKQRIAIARALVRNPRILLLDEATSSLDSESEKIVQNALDEARNGRTCLIIAHRLSTIRNVDQILVIENGLIAESGTHQQLIQQKGIYYQMYLTQCGIID